VSARLLAGWYETGRPADLRGHLDRYGPPPLRGRGRRHQPGPLVAAVSEAGLTGRGGAGFPTGTKLRAVAERARQAGPAVVVANGMESEPASQKDQTLLSVAPHLVLDGAVLAADAVGADVVHVCLSRDRQWLLDRVEAAVAERRHASLDPVPIEIHDLPHNYVSSEATALVHWLDGGEAKPLDTPPRTSTRGVGRRPTLVDNVETLAHVALIARYGSAWFRRAGVPDAAGTMLTTVSGAVGRSGVYEVEVGTRVGDVLAMAEVTNSPAPVGALLVGGYFGTWHDPRALAAVPLTPAALRRVGAGVGAGVLVALPPWVCGVSETARVLTYLAAQSAGQCGPCRFGLPAIADDFAQLASGRTRGAIIERLENRLRVVAGRGACRHPDGAVSLAASALSAFVGDVHAHARHRPCGPARHGRVLLPVPRPAAERVWE
jgi:NADH:ubiquinone oxidoreductase subunit F (NADH-binding)